MRASICSGPSTSLRLREVVDDRLAVVLAVAAAGNPADQVVAVGRRERQDLDELDAAVSPGSFISTKFGSIVCVRLLALLVHADFGGDGPEILAVVEHVGIRHVIQAVDGRLQLEQQLRIADVLAQLRRHRRRVLEQARENAAIRGDDRIARVEHVERRRAVVGVDDRLDAVAHVVDRGCDRAGSGARTG